MVCYISFFRLRGISGLVLLDWAILRQEAWAIAMPFQLVYSSLISMQDVSIIMEVRMVERLLGIVVVVLSCLNIVLIWCSYTLRMLNIG